MLTTSARCEVARDRLPAMTGASSKLTRRDAVRYNSNGGPLRFVEGGAPGDASWVGQLTTNNTRVIEGDVHYCRFCGLPVAIAESHGTEVECIEALRVELQRRGTSAAAREERERSAKGKDRKDTGKLATV